MNNGIVLGCIADDFTGASDSASFLVAGGMNTLLLNGVPTEDDVLFEGVEAIVIALKTRTQETSQAVRDTLRGIDALVHRGARQIYLKYCSTFDSTTRGNIGPICDAALEKLNTPYTLLCPSLPINGRTVKAGRLFVNGVPLDQTHMRHHPLTPMWDSFIPALMKDQSRYFCAVEESGGGDKARQTLAEYQRIYDHFYLIPDYETDADGERIARDFGGLPLLTGGSGLLYGLAKRYGRGTDRDFPAPDTGGGASILLAGSCSAATQAQVRRYLARGGRGIMADAEKLATGEQSAKQIEAAACALTAGSVLVYSAGSGGVDTQNGDSGAAAQLEELMAELACAAVKNGYTRVIVAGGETSGAVTKSLGFNAFQISESVAPGVPVMIPCSAKHLRLVLKSGNFGDEDFFAKSLKMTGGTL